MTKDVTSFSFSKIDQFMRCPLAYKMLNMEENEPIKNKSMNLGTIAHRFMELSWCYSKDEVISILQHEFKDYISIKDISAELYHYIPAIYENCVATELPISFQLSVYNMRGIIDRLDNINGMYRIVDYKYGMYEYTNKDLDNSIQLSLYAFYIMQQYNVDKCEISYHNLKQKTIIVKEIKKDDIDIQSILSFINAIKSSELFDEFPPKLSGNCMNCVVRTKCEPFKNWLVSSLPDIKDPDIDVDKILDYYYDVQEKEKIFKYQKKSLYPIIEEIMKSTNIIDKYSITFTKYGNIDIKKIKF